MAGKRKAADSDPEKKPKVLKQMNLFGTVAKAKVFTVSNVKESEVMALDLKGIDAMNASLQLGPPPTEGTYRAEAHDWRAHTAKKNCDFGARLDSTGSWCRY